jgi:hypothetical protein
MRWIPRQARNDIKNYHFPIGNNERRKIQHINIYAPGKKIPDFSSGIFILF